MKTIACINATAISSYATLALADGVSAFDRVVEYTTALPGLQQVVVFVGDTVDEAQPGAPEPGWPRHWEVVRRSAWSMEELLGELERIGRRNSGPETALVYYFTDAPFLDAGITERMLAAHRRYYAEYTFADGFPDSMAPVVLSCDLPERLRGLVKPEDDPAVWDELFTVLKRDINAFEVETELSAEDFRQLRLHLRCDRRRNYLLCRALFEAGGRDEASVLQLVKERPELLRTVPAYASVQIVRRSAQQVLYDPFRLVSGGRHGPVERPGPEHEMAPARFGAFLDILAGFTGDAVVEVSHWGEAGLHTALDELVGEASRRSRIELIIRTGGVGWPDGMLERVSQAANAATKLVVELDAEDEQLYREIRGEGFHEARRFLERGLELFGERCHLQAVRMDLNEEPLERYYRSWKARTPNVIIQKYDDCAGRLPSRKVVDLSPLHRMPCWHLKRDLVVLIDGSVPMCKEDLDSSQPWGNVFEDEIGTVWAAGDAQYRRHLESDYPPLCRSCDEYYTFNF